ncbi:MAG: hypothetical protein ACRCWQ_03735 [Bacilli bacterium]
MRKMKIAQLAALGVGLSAAMHFNSRKAKKQMHRVFKKVKRSLF